MNASTVAVDRISFILKVTYLLLAVFGSSMTFWAQKGTALGKLFAPALHALSVHVSSAAIKCAFSQGGIILRLHRACYHS